jgi:hypothetical protein
MLLDTLSLLLGLLHYTITLLSISYVTLIVVLFVLDVETFFSDLVSGYSHLEYIFYN